MKTAIIGAGASGMAAAGFLLREEDQEVLIFEQNEYPGKKLGITGKGRCNVTNNCAPEEFLKNVIRNSKFLYSAAYSFTAADTMELFESLGVPLKTERGNRVFPQSDKARDIVNALKRFSLSRGAKLISAKAEKIITDGDGKVTGVVAGGKEYAADNVILATGGVSYPSTGANDSGYALARQLGHTVVKPEPSLVPLALDSPYPAKLMGLSLKNVTLTVYEEGKKIFSEFGEILFTHFGLSGPLTLSASAFMSEGKKYSCAIDLKPALDKQKLNERLLRDFSSELNKNFSNSLSKLLPAKLIPAFVEMSGIDPDKKINSITKAEREKIISLLKDVPFEIAGKRGLSEAVVTRGGVDVTKVNPKNMESKIIKNLFFAGEILDVDALTGGFNLQIAFSTAFLAAKSIIKKQIKKY